MKDCRSLNFTFKNKDYYAIVRHRQVGDKSFYHVRIMNQKLDNLLNAGNHSLLYEKNGQILKMGNTHASGNLGLLRKAIVNEIFKSVTGHEDPYPYRWISNYDMITPY
ncbi:MAG: hypothetical protein ABW174_02105 [Flavitalea sp.]